MMEGVADPGGTESIRREGLVVLQPDLFILEGIGFSEFAAEVPCERMDFPTFLYILDNDGQVGFFS